MLPQRFAIVIGKSGVGKSQTLAQIVDAALRGKTKLTDLEGNRPVFNRILGFYPSTSTAPVFPSERRKRARLVLALLDGEWALAPDDQRSHRSAGA